MLFFNPDCPINPPHPWPGGACLAAGGEGAALFLHGQHLRAGEPWRVLLESTYRNLS